MPAADSLNLFSLAFDDFSLNDDEMLMAAVSMFLELGLVKTFNIEKEVSAPPRPTGLLPRYTRPNKSTRSTKLFSHGPRKTLKKKKKTRLVLQKKKKRNLGGDDSRHGVATPTFSFAFFFLFRFFVFKRSRLLAVDF